MYWRVLTPLVVIWGFVYQRLNKEHTCDDYVAHLRSGAVDELDAADRHDRPLSQRLVSESNSSYVQGRNRLPTAILQSARCRVASYAAEQAGAAGEWRGWRVRLLDGTTFRLPPEGDLVATYGQSRNQHGAAHWVQARAVLACDYFTQAVVGLAVGSYYSDETDYLCEVLNEEKQAAALYVGDRHFGVYRVLQAVQAQGHQVLLRLQKKQAQALLKRNQLTEPQGAADEPLVWAPSANDQCFAHLPAEPIAGRLLIVPVHQAGFRPFTLYLFTTLLDTEQFSGNDLCDLYQQRWNVEIQFRHIKTALEMDFLPVRSAAIFLKELNAGILTYNLVCCLMTQAACRLNVLPAQLSFKQSLRRLLSLFSDGYPAWVAQETTVADWLLHRLGQCRLPARPNKVKHEPRQVRYPPRVYAELRGDRALARLKNLEKLQASSET